MLTMRIAVVAFATVATVFSTLVLACAIGDLVVRACGLEDFID